MGSGRRRLPRGGSDPQPAPQSRSSQAYSYLPLASDQGVIIKSVDGGDPCVVNPLAGVGVPDADWQARCSLSDLDLDDSNLDSTDTAGNLSFTLEYENLGNRTLSDVRVVDVLPYDGDGVAEPESNSGENGVDLPTRGDARLPGSAFEGVVGLAAVTGALPSDTVPQGYLVTDATPSEISRDPDNAYTDVLWCNPGESTPVNAATAEPGAIGGCPTTAFEVTAVFAYLAPIPVQETGSLSLVLDTEGAECDDIWTNTFGARTANIALPVRSNDVSVMMQCDPEVDIEK